MIHEIKLSENEINKYRTIFRNLEFIPMIIKGFEYKSNKLIFVEDNVLSNEVWKHYNKLLKDENMYVYSWRWLKKDGKMSKEGQPNIKELIQKTGDYYRKSKDD